MQDQPPLAVLIGGLTHGFRLPGDRLALIAEAEIFGARAHREARQAKGPGLGDLGEITEGDLVVHDRTRHRPLPGAEEAGRAGGAGGGGHVAGPPGRRLPPEAGGPGLPAAGVRRRQHLPARLPDRPGPAVHRPAGRRRPAGQAGGQDLAGEAAAGLGRGAQGGRGAAAAVRPAPGAARPSFPGAGRGVPGVRGDVPVRGDARPGQGHRRRAGGHAARDGRWTG